jgi:uncharacterized protein (PEP-CTERM system associated)
MPLAAQQLPLAAQQLPLAAQQLPLAAQQLPLAEPFVTARITASDNAGLGFTTSGRDLITEVTGGVRFRSEGARVSLFGTVSLDAFAYARRTQANDIVPTVDLTGRVAAVERFFFIEGAARTTQTPIDPFAPGLTATSTQNNATLTQYRLSPYLQSDPSSTLHFRARSDNTTTKDYGQNSAAVDAIDNAYFGFHTISLERDPVPVGWRLSAERSETRYQGELVPIVSDVARALLNFAVTDTIRAGLRVGAEQNNFLVDQSWQSIYGGQFSWRPSERTALDFEAEKRFFGNGVQFVFTHRMPQLAWELRASRTLDTTPSSLFTLPPTDNVSALLDATLTTRIPNPADRATQVQNIISRQGLPSSTAIGIPILAQRVSVSENASLGLSFLGIRNTIALTLFATRTRDAVDEGPLATDSAATNNIQQGATIAYALRVTPTVAAGLIVTGTHIKSLDTATTAERTNDASVRANLVVQLAPKTTGLLGASQRRLISNTASSGHETTVFGGLEHRF